jgi:hypothetical protein
LGVGVDLSSVNGEVGYQWYESTTNSYEGGRKIEGETGESMRVDTMSAGMKFYYVEVSNRVGGDITRTESIISQVIVKAAPMPELRMDSELVGGVVSVGAGFRINTVVNSSDGKTSYRWFSNTTPSNVGGEMVEDAYNPYLIVSSEVEQRLYYYAEVTVRRDALEVVDKTEPVVVEVIDPSIRDIRINSANKVSHEEISGAIDLRVEARVSSGELKYQWYESDENGGNGVEIAKGLGSSLRVSTVGRGTKYYFVEVTNVVQVQQSRGGGIRVHYNKVVSKVFAVRLNENISSPILVIVVLSALLMLILAIVIIFIVRVIMNRRVSGERVIVDSSNIYDEKYGII